MLLWAHWSAERLDVPDLVQIRMTETTHEMHRLYRDGLEIRRHILTVYKEIVMGNVLTRS
jgi:hypothetical protein